MIRLIATDLDGTFLAEDGTIPEENLAALALAVRRGVPVVVATGRPTRWLDLLAGLPIHHEVIVSNGAGVLELSTGKLGQIVAVAAEVALPVSGRIRREIPGVTFAVETGRYFGFEVATPVLERTGPGVVVAELPQLVQLPGILKLLVYHADLTSAELFSAVQPVVGADLVPTFSTLAEYPGLVELAAPGVSKASALARICAELGVAAAEVAAFGDMPNDAEMLAWSGRGFAAAGAHPSLISLGFEQLSGSVGAAITELLNPSG